LIRNINWRKFGKLLNTRYSLKDNLNAKQSRGINSSRKKILEKKQVDLRTRLNRNLTKKRALDIEINREFEELKRTEVAIEISSKENTWLNQ
jgi:hypothetical protein